MIERINLSHDYSISRVVKGNWQLSDGHNLKQPISIEQALADMAVFAQAGITTLDMADIYTGVEELVGQFIKNNPSLPVQIHTKYVPDLDQLTKLTFKDTETIIDRSLMRLGMQQLDLVQFHWWDFSIPFYVDAAHNLKKLQDKGKIRLIGVTNFDADHLHEIINAGIPVSTAQVQYSVLDRRPEKSFGVFCQKNNIKFLCYGTLAGGFINPRYLNQPEPSELSNRSLVKYKLIIDEIGGWRVFQNLLHTLDAVAKKYNNPDITLSEIALAYTLSRPQVAAVIVGASNANYIKKLEHVGNLALTPQEIDAIDQHLLHIPNVQGEMYELERHDPTHKGIMRMKLNAKA